MPSLSINSKDLDTLGINLKDLLKAISHTKGDTNEVIKIKKRKKKGKQKTKNIRTNKANLISPFPNNQPKFTQYPQMGSSGAFFPSSRVERVEVTKQPEPQQNNKQLDEFQNKMEKQLNATSDATRLLLADRFYANKFFPSQNNPPPANLEYLPFNTFREPIQVDRQDRFGIVQTNDFYSNARNNDGEGFSVEELPDELPTLDEPTMQTDTPAENIDMVDAPPELTNTEQEVMQLAGITEPVRIPSTPTYEALPDLTTMINDVKKGYPLGNAKNDLPTEIVKKRPGRPVGSKNKNNPLTSGQVHSTRSSHDTLTNPENITPDKYARQDMKNQRTIDEIFTPRNSEKKRQNRENMEVLHLQSSPAEQKPPKTIRSRSVPTNGDRKAIILG